jgi:uncharacterized membrane protein YeaQ/YmgE (transglycosylase-associated protein family)
MDLALTILIGLAIGAMVELLLPGHHAAELLLAMLLGISGALVARFIGVAAGFFEPDEPGNFVASIVGAVVVLLLYGLIFRRIMRRH